MHILARFRYVFWLEFFIRTNTLEAPQAIFFNFFILKFFIKSAVDIFKTIFKNLLQTEYMKIRKF